MRKLVSVKHLKGSFTHGSDELEPGRIKVIHRFGTCAKVSLRISAEHPFTGVFADGGPALLRLSDGANMGNPILGAALKFFVDGKLSLNYFANAHKLGRPPKGFLSTVLANSPQIGTDPASKLVGNRFQKTADALGGKRLYANYLPLHHMAGVQEDGTAVGEPVVPDRMELHPTDEVLDVVGRKGDWRERLAPLEAGMRLWQVKLAPAIDEPATAVGDFVLESGFVASAFGDERLFFQHDVGPTS
jgi:hypothetical protein